MRFKHARWCAKGWIMLETNRWHYRRTPRASSIFLFIYFSGHSKRSEKSPKIRVQIICFVQTCMYLRVSTSEDPNEENVA